MIRAGAGEDFLQQEFEAGGMGFLEDMWDLKGLKIFREKFDFPGGDTFENIDFSHAEFYHTRFSNAVFYSHMAFTRVYNCEFNRCIFSFNHAYGGTFEKCRFTQCDFVQGNTFTNCSLRDVSFTQCFMPDRVFVDCSFDQRTQVDPSAPKPSRMSSESFRPDPKDLADVLAGIEEAYRAGGVHTQARRYYFRRMQAVTRHNSATRFEKGLGLIKEYLAGYGVRPLRVLAAMVIAFAGSAALFATAVSPPDSVILASGALFTFGAKADLLTELVVPYRMLYVMTAFVGISLTALFITVLANIWFREH
jgi:hypothetical protein